jgi:hypothetical protein
MRRFFNPTKIAAALLALVLSSAASYALFFSSVDRIIAANQSFPAISGCGTGTLAAGSSDMAGTFTATGATGCTLTFGQAWASAPSCTVNELTVNTAARTTTVSTTALVVASGTSGSTYSYICIGKSGG